MYLSMFKYLPATMKLISIIFLVKYVDSAMEGTIVGGVLTSSSYYPYQVFLDIHGLKDWICGGSFLNQAMVLTAAHCLEDLNTNENQKLFIKFGSEALPTSMMRRMKSYRIHPKYDDFTMFADIAMVHCKKPVHLGGNVQRVAVMRNPPNTKIAFVAGWGVIDEYMSNTDILKEVKQKIYSTQACATLHLPNGSFCAGNAGAIDDIIIEGYPSLGDSGGPLVINDLIQIGIVSYRVKGYTNVAYTNVSYHMPWIRRTAHELYCIPENII